MGKGPTAYRRGAICVLTAATLALAAHPAGAGEFAVANCQGDVLNFSTRAFESLVTQGMKIRRACNPEGPGLRGLITSNVVGERHVERGSIAQVTLTAPPGTLFTRFRWAGTMRRRDCRYALQLWADGPGINAIPMKNVKANQRCPKPTIAQAAYFPVYNYAIPGATRVVQRVVCVGDDARKYCSARGSNYVRTYKAEVGIADVLAPSASIIGDTPLARGEWVGGIQPLNYDASDNVGVRKTDANALGKTGGTDQRPCAFATPDEMFADRIPCPNGPGQIGVETARLLEGTQALVVQVQDTAGNLGDSPPVTARIDNSAPGRVDVGVEGGQEWRNRNDFAAAWTNTPEPDRAPIAGVRYMLCPAAAGSCIRGDHTDGDISHLGIAVPAPGEWTLSLWRGDAAGNETEAAASVPVTLRYDPEPPQLGFEQLSTTDPTLVAVQVTDKVSGLANGVIEMSASGSGVWQTLPTEKAGNRLLARIDDATLPAGGYVLRARASDLARNESSTDRQLDGTAMALTLPLRTASSMRAGFRRVRTVRRTIRRHGERRVVRRRITVLAPSVRVRRGGEARVLGRLVDRDGAGLAGAEVRVLSGSSLSPEQVIAVLHTDRDGRFNYVASGSTSRTLRFSYAGSPIALPAEHAITMSVPAVTSLDASNTRALNGQAVIFHGRLRTRPVPVGGKLVELQARLSDRWQTFRTTRTDDAGRWAIRYRFKRTRGVQRFRFRVRLPRETSYPFAPGGSRALTVRVKGL